MTNDKNHAVTYRLSDLDTQISRLQRAHGAVAAYAEAYRLRTGIKLPVWDLDKAIQAARKRVARHLGADDRYPAGYRHPQTREKARRLRQMARAAAKQPVGLADAA